MNKELNDLNFYIGGVTSLSSDFATYMGISGSVLDILYLLYLENGSCLQSLFYKRTGVSRSTVNSAIKKMEREGLLTLKDGQGRNKIVHVTAMGDKLMQQTAGRWVSMECNIWKSWTDQDRADYLRLSKNYYESLKNEMERMKENE